MTTRTGPDYMVLDIETGPLPLEQREYLRPRRDKIPLGNLKDPAKIDAKVAEVMADFEAGTDAALSALSGRVLLVGVLAGGKITHIHNDDEAQLLRDVWAMVDSTDTTHIVGHNIGFDARFLIRRSMINGVRVPWTLVDDLRKYSPTYWLDTMSAWTLGDRTERYVSLDHMCGALGVPSPKHGEITGATFAAHWNAGNRESCLEYNAADLRATETVAKKLGVI